MEAAVAIEQDPLSVGAGLSFNTSADQGFLKGADIIQLLEKATKKSLI